MTIIRAALLAGLATLAVAPAAGAHQTAVSHGIAVTVHVAPDDEPVAGQPATINLVRVKRKGWKFSYRTCRCRLVLTDSSGSKLLDRSIRGRRTTYTFPRAGAYQLTVTGRMTRGRSKRSFTARFAYRAT